MVFFMLTNILEVSTEILYYGSETADGATAMSYTEVELNVQNVGTTVVPNPEAFTNFQK